MTTVLVITAITCILLICLVLFKPSANIKNNSISIYWLAPLAGALVIIASGLLSFEKVIDGMTADTAINPFKILILFVSMTSLSVFLDEIGFFSKMACFALKKAKSSQLTLFIYLYVTVSVLTVFTSNDIIILTFTPFICYFAKNAHIDAIPYLFAEFVAANTWSMLLVIGNPTNIYLSASNGISFIRYLGVMLLPTIIAGCVSFGVLLLLFGRKLKKQIQPCIREAEIQDKGLLIIGLAHLGLCTLLLVVSAYIDFEMWLITLAFAISMFVFVSVYSFVKKRKPVTLIHTLRRMPWELIPFVLSMFVLVMALDEYGVTQRMAGILDNGSPVFSYGIASYLYANLINNIPMSVLFSSIINTADASVKMQAAYASVIGSNICAFFTPIGALAGIMWSGILKQQKIKFSFLTYIKYGSVISSIVLIAALFGLTLVL